MDDDGLLALATLLDRLVRILRVEKSVGLRRNQADRIAFGEHRVRALDGRNVVRHGVDRIAGLHFVVAIPPDGHDEGAVCGGARLELALARWRLEVALSVRSPLVGRTDIEAHPAHLLERL